MHLSASFGQEIPEKKSLGTNGLTIQISWNQIVVLSKIFSSEKHIAFYHMECYFTHTKMEPELVVLYFGRFSVKML